MRWIFNIILVVFALFIIALIGSNNVNYEYFPFTGFSVIAPNLPSVCDISSLGTFWDNTFQTKYKKPNLNLIIKNDVASVINGKCFNFVIYNISGDNFLVYIAHEYLPDPSYSESFLAGVSNFSNAINLPSDTQQLMQTLKSMPINAGNIKSRTLQVDSSSSAQSNFSGVFTILTPPQNLALQNGNYIYSDQVNHTASNYSNTTYNLVSQDKDYLYSKYEVYKTYNNTVSFSGNIPNFTITEDFNLSNAFDLDNYFTFTGFGQKTFVLYANPSNVIQINVDANNFVNIIPLLNKNGVVQANVSAKIGNSPEKFSNNFKINITPVNDAPTLIEDFNNYVWYKNANKTLDMTEFFSDPESSGLTYNTTGNNYIKIIFTDDDKAIMIPQNNWVGVETVIFYANDSILKTASNNFTLTVEEPLQGGSGNSSPEINLKDPNLPTVSLKIGDRKKLKINVTNLDNDPLTYTWTVNGINKFVNSNEFYFNAASVGTFLVKVSVTDGAFTKEASWSLIVSAAQITNGTTPPQNIPISSQIIEKSFIGKLLESKLVFIIAGIVILLAIIILAVYLVPKIFGDKHEVMEVKGSGAGVEKPVETTKSFFESLKYDELTPLVSFISKYKSRGVPDSEIRKTLIKKGWKQNQINMAFERLEPKN